MIRTTLRAVFSGYVLAMLLLPALASAAPKDGREHLRFDTGWTFHLGDLDASAGLAIEKWQWRNAADGLTPPPSAANIEKEPGAVWQEAIPGQDVFKGRKGFAWFVTRLPALPTLNRVLQFTSVDDNATVYLNGQKLFSHEGWNEPFEVYLDKVWKENGENVLAVLVENTDGAGGIGAVTLVAQGTDTGKGPASPGYDDSSWRTVHLPHDFVVEGTFDSKANTDHGSLPTGVGWYRKAFTVPAEDKGRRLAVTFDGIYRNSQVWLNGRSLGRHKSGYIGVRYDITDAVNYGGRNVLVVRADARSFEGWWYEGGGIYRHVWLDKTAATHIAPHGVFVHSTVGDDNTAAIQMEIALQNDAAQNADCRVQATILRPDGGRVASLEVTQSLASGETRLLKPQIKIAAPLLWSIETPNLYRLETRLLKDGKELDRVTTPFGIRTIRFDANKGFFLNGKPVKLKGTCNHQDFAGVGLAMPDNLLEWRIRKLKEMGSNAYRCSHNPPAAELLDACDRLGMVVMDETRHLGDTTSGKAPRGTKYDDLSELKEMVRRDRNHPSIILWSMCNEEGLQGTEEGGRIFAAMRKATLDLDPTRPVTSAMNGGWGQGISLVQDLQGFNYNPGGYEAYHKRFPNQPAYGSETASAVSTRGEYVNDKTKGYVSAYDVNAPPWAQTAEVAWKAVAEREWVAGAFVWTGFDYKGEPTPYGWPCINSHFGIMDMCGFPKDTYYYYQAWWSGKDVVHLLPHWNWAGNDGKLVEVWCHSNADRVELFLNGKSLGAKEMPRLGHLEWKVAYVPGRLEARGYRGGKLIGTDVVETTGAPAQIRLTPHATTVKADGEEVILVTATVLDAKGRVVPFADNEITFTAAGAGQVVGVGNGDPSSHEPDRAAKRKAFHGLCMAVVQAGETPGTITFTASAPGLKGASLTLKAAK